MPSQQLRSSALCRKPLCARSRMFSGSLRARCSRSSAERMTAAAAANVRNWRQISGASGTKDAATAGSMGAILVSELGPQTEFDSYLSPADGLLVNTQMIEGPNAVVHLRRSAPAAVCRGSRVMTCRRSASRRSYHSLACPYRSLAARVFRSLDRALPRRRACLRWTGSPTRSAPEARRGSIGLRRTYGERAPTKVTVPTETMGEGLQRIDGVTYDFKRFVDAESDLQLAALLPEQKVLMAFDLVFSPNERRLHRRQSFRSLDDRSRVAQGA